MFITLDGKEVLDNPFISGTTTLLDAAADPDAAGEIQRNSTDLKGYSGGAVRSLSDLHVSKTDATVAPTVNDDVTGGYEPGSAWVDVTNDKAYVCLDATDGAAVWTEVTQAGTGKLVQFVSTQTGAVATGTTQVPEDDTIPQNTEGDEYMTLAVTPNNTNNKLIIEVTFMYAESGGQNCGIGLFQDATASAIAAARMTPGGANQLLTATFTHVMDAGTTSSTTFKVRAGTEGSTLTFNGHSAARRLGGALASGIRIWEYEV